MSTIVNELIKLANKIDQKYNYIDFPKLEHKSLLKRLKSDKPIYTTRILKEKDKYKVDAILNSPFGKLQVISITEIANLKDHPFIKELSDEDKKILNGHKMDLIKLIKHHLE